MSDALWVLLLVIVICVWFLHVQSLKRNQADCTSKPVTPKETTSSLKPAPKAPEPLQSAHSLSSKRPEEPVPQVSKPLQDPVPKPVAVEVSPASYRKPWSEGAGLEVTEDFQRAFNLMEQTRDHIFITGKAGTGKSTLLRFFRDNTKKNVAIVAPTGIAAINAGGSTIHSFFKFPTGVVTNKDIKKLSNKRDLFKALDALVIDEASMVRADVMDAIDLSLRLNRGIDKPFGGVQVILFGDLYQLPPVIDDKEVKRFLDDTYGGCPYFFAARVFREAHLTMLELSKVFRQKEGWFIELLDKVRKGEVSDTHLRLLNSRVSLVPPRDEPAVILTTRRDQASEINLSELRKLPGREYIYKAKITGTFDEASYPTDRWLRLKEGAQVMLLRNDPFGRWVNGTLAVVKELSESLVKVFVSGVTYSVEPVTWEKTEYYYDPHERKIESRVVGAFQQLPMSLAWAVTIHKSQGKTFDRVIIDLGRGAFEHGQVYVALSRCRSFDGIYLRTPIRPHDIRVNPLVKKFEAELRGRSTASPLAAEYKIRAGEPWSPSAEAAEPIYHRDPAYENSEFAIGSLCLSCRKLIERTCPGAVAGKNVAGFKQWHCPGGYTLLSRGEGSCYH